MPPRTAKKEPEIFVGANIVESLHKKLMGIAKREDRKLAWIIRRALEKFSENHKEQ